MADKIVAEYTVKVDKAIKDLEKLAKKVDKVDDERKKTQDGFKSMSSQLSGGFKQLGGVIAGAFATQQLVSFGKEAVKVAAQAEGIQRAFERLNRPNLLNELRKATRGTVDDLTLMRQAVRAENFKVPLENLGKFFDFATQRSIQTGESVDYLVNSIIDGIGRKSTLVLDNLGISASELQEEMKKVGDFGEAAGNIIARELEKSGNVADTTAIKLARVTTELENIKVSAGEALIELGDFALALNDVVGVSNQSNESLEKYVDRATKAGLAITELSLARNEEIGVLERYKILLFGLSEAQQKDIELSRQSLELSEDEYVTVGGLNQLYDSLDKKEKEQIKNLAYYKDLIEKLKAEQEDSNTTRERVRDLENEINEAIRQRLLLLGRLRETGGATFEPIEPITEISPLGQAEQLTEDLISEQHRRDSEIAAIKQQYRKWDLEAEEEHQQELNDKFFMYVEATSDLFSNLAQIQRNLNQEELDLLKERLEKGEISRDEYEQKRKSILQDQAESEKALAIFDATINGAAAVVNALSTDPTGILAGIVGASVAAQIAAISSQPTPQFEEGGFVDSKGYISGRSHKTGGVLIEAEGGEYITSKKYAQKNKEILEAINSGNWEKYKFENIISPAINQVLEGGMDNIGASIVLQNKFNDKNMLRAFDRNRSAARQDAQYIVSELSKNFKGRLRGGFA